MTTQSPAPPAPGAPLKAASSGAKALGPASGKGLPTRRRWGRVAIGAILALVGGWVSVALYVTAGNRVEVVMIARDVDRFEELSGDDLTTVRVAADPEVSTIAGDEIDDLVGRMPDVGLREGTLLSTDQLMDDDDSPLEGNELSVPATVSSQTADNIDPGDEVRVALGDGDDAAEIREVRARVIAVGGEIDDERGAHAVVLAASQSDALVLAVAAKDGPLAVVVGGG